ncbi:MAG: ribulose-phosphate 3-epimerase [Bacteroidetes bacterium]|nr:ribulose-phosphate 3-epimerase [Bacteroidota bacterium]
MPASAPIISPSVLSADFAHLGRDVELINDSDADWIHCDIMDGRFVPNISFGLPVLQAIKRYARKPLDVHLMIVEPEKYLEDFRKAGADLLTVQYEACTHLNRTLHAIRELGMRPGIAINPATPVELLRDSLADADLILLMSVNPGFGGQSFIANTWNRLQRLRALRDELSPDTLIEIDGGVNDQNAAGLLAHGADALVAGNFVFKAADPRAAIASLKTHTR